MSGKSKSAKERYIRLKLLKAALWLQEEGEEYADAGRSSGPTDSEFFGRRSQRLIGMARYLRDLAKTYAP